MCGVSQRQNTNNCLIKTQLITGIAGSPARAPRRGNLPEGKTKNSIVVGVVVPPKKIGEKHYKKMSKTEKGKVKRTLIGGQALMEGVMMQGASSMALSVRTEEGDILTETKRLKKRGVISRIPIIRGCVAFVRSLVTGTGTLLRSAEVIYPEEETPSKASYAVATIIGIVLAVGLFILLPSFLVSMLAKAVNLGILLESLIEGLIRIALFVLYLFIVSRLKDIKRTFMYHGAEHRTINCFEKGMELTPENVQKCSTRHNRCGTTFLFFVMVVSILVFSLVTWLLSLLGWTNIGTFARMGIRLLLLPVVAGLSFELLRFLALLPDNVFTDILRAPGLALQRLTTYPPDIDMAEVAISSFKLVQEMDADENIQPHAFGELTVPELRAVIRRRLEKAGKTEEAEVEWILCYAFGVKKGELSGVNRSTMAQYRKACAVCAERAKGKPFDYITGYSEFYGIRIAVTPDVLIPRLDTEVVAETAIKAIKSMEKPVCALDLMTGSGCIAAAIVENTGANVTASDVSEGALNVATMNLERYKVKIVKSDVFANIDGKFDLIVSNPPYIETKVVDTLEPEVTCQPKIALDGGEDGLKFYRTIAAEAPAHLTDRGTLVLEIGYDQGAAVSELLKENFDNVEVIKDFCGNDRVVKATRK